MTMPRSPEAREGWEFHRWQGFTRFRPAPDGRLVARIAPKFDLLQGLAGYFARRLRGQAWTIVDEPRSQAAVCGADGRWRIVPWTADALGAGPADDVERLWLTYFDTIAIDQRKNPRLQNQHIPRRYRAYLPECESSRDSVQSPPSPESSL